jgi:hypothetical protein
MKRPPEIDEDALKRGDELLRRMLETPPKQHNAMSAPKPAPKRAKKPQK